MTFFTKNFKISSNIKVISFNVFDTLLLRPFEKPSHLFKFIEEYVNKNLENKIDFEKTRIKAEKLARKKAFPREEISIDEIYDNFPQIPLKNRGAIKFLEIETEFKLCFPRHSGQMIYNLAKKHNFKLVAIVDSYLDTNFIRKLLEKNGFVFDEIFCSSSTFNQKETGHAYPEVIKALKVKPYEILHIGSDAISDIKNASQKGINVFHLPLLQQVFYSNIHYKRLFYNKNNCLLTSALISLIYEKIDISKKEFCKESLFDNSLYNLGFIGFGAVMFSFTNWIYKYSLKRNVSTLFFLARDGFIMKQIMKIMFPKAPFEVKYLEASRLSLMPVSITTKDEVIENYSSKYRNTTLGNFITEKLGMNPALIVPSLKAIGFTSLNEKIKSFLHTKKEKERLKKVVSFYANDILKNLEHGKESVNLFLQKAGIFKERTAVCDIGYGGTIQKILEEVGKDKILGLYLMTNSKAKALKYSHGFLENNLDLKKFKRYKSFIRIIESTLFCSPTGTVVGYKKNGDPIFEKLEQIESGRLHANSYTWKGMIDFYLLLQKRFDKDINLIKYNRKGLLKLFLSFVKTPTQRDALLLKGIFFENKSNAGGYRDITSFNIWKAGSMAINKPILSKTIHFVKRLYS